jgi:hypothetical protein
MLRSFQLDDGADELGRAQAVGQTGGDERARTDPDVDMHVPGEIDPIERFFESTQGSDLVDGALETAAGQGQTDPWFVVARCRLPAHASSVV